MPPVSEAQRRFMRAQAKPQKGHKRKVPMKIAKEFAREDEGGKLPERLSRRVRGLTR